MRTVFRPCAHADADSENSTAASAAKTPSVIIANHTSHKDALFLFSTIRDTDIAMLVARDWYDKPQFNWIMKRAGCIPCDRFGLDTAWLRDALSALKDGKSILIFPEGRTRNDGELNEFKSGFSMLASLSGAPVISIGLSGKYKPFCKTHYVVGAPETLDRTKSMNSEYLKEKSDEFRLTVSRLKKEALKYT